MQNKMKDELIQKYVAGSSSQQERIEMAMWAAEDSQNKQKVLDASKLYVTSLMMDAPAQRSVCGRNRVRTFFRYAAACAAVCAALLTGYHISQLRSESDAPYTLSAATLNVPSGQRSKLTLSDGTTVWINSNSTLEFVNENGVRKVNLYGEALFDVVKDAEHPFIVHTQKADVKVLGTKFNVASYSEDDFCVKLFNGSVNVQDAESEEQITLQPQQMLSYVDGKYVQEHIDQTSRRSWQDGYYSFEEKPYREILCTIGNYLGYEIVIENQSVASEQCSCTFRIEDGMAHFLEILNLIHPFRYTIDETNKIITIK